MDDHYYLNGINEIGYQLWDWRYNIAYSNNRVITPSEIDKISGYGGRWFSITLDGYNHSSVGNNYFPSDNARVWYTPRYESYISVEQFHRLIWCVHNYYTNGNVYSDFIAGV